MGTLTFRQPRLVALILLVLITAGLSSLEEGSIVSLTVVRGDRGLQATEVVSVDAAEGGEVPVAGARPTEIAAEAVPEGDFMPARVKWRCICVNS